MAAEVNMETLIQYLEQFGWSRYRAEEEEMEQEGVILTGWRSSPEAAGFNLIIDPMVERDSLSLRVPRVTEAPLDSTPGDRLASLLMILGWVNYHVILGKFSYDPSDGEVRFSLNVPIDENEFTYAQFEHALGVIMTVVDTWAPRFQALLGGEEQLAEIMIEDAREGGAPENLLENLKETFQRWGGWSFGGGN